MAVYRSRSRSTAASSIRRRPGSPLPPVEPRPIFSALEDFNRGSLPHNDQLKQWLSYLGRSFAVPTRDLSASGKVLMRDLSELIKLLQRVVDEKNGDELLQRFFYHSRLASRLALHGLNQSGRIQVVNQPRRQVYLLGAKDEEVRLNAKRLRKEAIKEVRALYRLVQFMVSSTELRDLVINGQNIAKRIFRSTAGRTGGRGAGWQEEEQYQPTKRVSFTTPTAYTAFTTPQQVNIEKQQPQYYETEEPYKGKNGQNLDERIDKLRQQVRSTERTLHGIASEQESYQEGGYRPLSSGAYVEVSTRTTEQGEWIYESKPPPEIRRIQEGMQTRAEEFPEPTEKQFKEMPIFGEPEVEKPVEAEQEFSKYTLPPTAYETPEAKEGQTRTGFEQVVPEVSDDREKIAEDMRLWFRKVSGNPELQKTFRDALKYMTALQTLTTGAIQEPTGPISTELQYEENIKAAQRDLRHLLERFAANQSLDPLIEIFGRLKANMVSDYELKDFFGDWSSFVRRCLKDDAYLDSDEYKRRALFLIDRSRNFAESKYSQDFEDANRIVQGFLKGWQQDHLTKELGNVLQRIVREDLMVGASGSTQATNGLFLFSVLKPDLLHDFRHVILPSMLSNLYELPIPRIESFSDGTHLILDNIVIPAGGFMPVDLDVRSLATLRMNPRDRILGTSTVGRHARDVKSGWHNGIRVRMSGMQMSLRDVRFQVDKTSGWPKLHDDGLADMHFGGKGMSIIMNMAAASSKHMPGKRGIFGGKKTRRAAGRAEEMETFMFDPKYVRVKIDKLKLRMHDTRRDWMYKMASPFMASRIKRQIEKSIRDQLVSAVHGLDSISRSISKGVLVDEYN